MSPSNLELDRSNGLNLIHLVLLKGAENHHAMFLPNNRLDDADYESEIRFPEKKIV